MMKARALHVLKRAWLLIFIMFSLVFVIQYFQTHISQVRKTFNISIKFFLMTVLLQILFWLIVSLIWKSIVSSVGVRGITLVESFSQLTFVSLGKYVPGKIWGVIARWAKMKQMGVQTSAVLLATFNEQYFLLHASFFMSCVIGSYLVNVPWNWIIVLVGITSVFFGKYLKKICVHIFIFGTKRINRNIKMTIHPESDSVVRYLTLLNGFNLAWISIGLVFAGVYLTFFNVKLSIDVVLALILANTIGISVGFFALFAPGGIGVREAVTSTIMSYFIPLQDAILLSLLFRLWMVVAELFAGLLVFFLVGKSFLQKQTDIQ